MRVITTDAIRHHHPNIENELWQTACFAKDQDPDIMLMGLLVRVKLASEKDYWAGITYPEEESVYYGKKYIHPAGRINLYLGSDVTSRNKAILMAHELKHVGQFHRGRKLKGFLNLDHMHSDDEIEEDCIFFEKEIANKIFSLKQFVGRQ